MPDKIILAGNPNVGKSTIFNSLTGLRQHTGNWTGKTVGCSYGFFETKNKNLMIIDTPGTYSLRADSPDEKAAMDTLCFEPCRHIVYVCDACCLERSLYLLLQIMEKRTDIIVCINLIDEAKRKGIEIDIEKLSDELKLPVMEMSASRGDGIDELINEITKKGCSKIKNDELRSTTDALKKRSAEIALKTLKEKYGSNKICILDRLLCSRALGIPIMLIMLFALLWISTSAANIPTALLNAVFSHLGEALRRCLFSLGLGELLTAAIIDGIYSTTAWVIAVMLPPIVIFFPLFTLLEDLGLLPRISFNMDPLFKCCGSCGKQALTMCMGLGCNAVGVTSSRIISSPGQRLVSILTNSFMPCNGRFPTIILLSSIAFPLGSSFLAPAAVTLSILLGAAVTLISTRLLTPVLCKGEALSFTLELPPYRKPKIIETLIHSLYDRSAKVLFRAIKASAPAGLVIWLLANIKIADISLIAHISAFLDAPASIIGLNGTILFAFILALPANEIVMPIIMMCCCSGSSLMELPGATEMAVILNDAGWSVSTMICVIIFTLFHWPCSTTLMTIKKECGKIKWVILSAILPCLWGTVLCMLVNCILKI